MTSFCAGAVVIKSTAFQLDVQELQELPSPSLVLCLFRVTFGTGGQG